MSMLPSRSLMNVHLLVFEMRPLSIDLRYIGNNADPWLDLPSRSAVTICSASAWAPRLSKPVRRSVTLSHLVREDTSTLAVTGSALGGIPLANRCHSPPWIPRDHSYMYRL